ncbi:hypothetical protein ACHAPT_006247 [Fusarium lateritium]
MDTLKDQFSRRWTELICPEYTLSTWIKMYASKGFDVAVPDGKPRFPIALFICRESRIHTLRSVELLKNRYDEARSFYFNKNADMLWIYTDPHPDPDEPGFYGAPMDLIDKAEAARMSRLLRAYGGQLNKIKTVLNSDADWWEPHFANYMHHLHGVSVVYVYWDSELATAFKDLSETLECVARGSDRTVTFRFVNKDFTLYEEQKVQGVSVLQWETSGHGWWVKR